MPAHREGRATRVAHPQPSSNGQPASDAANIVVRPFNDLDLVAAAFEQ
jgi:glutamate-1-semialdehyde aminotransferase